MLHKIFSVLFFIFLSVPSLSAPNYSILKRFPAISSIVTPAYSNTLSMEVHSFILRAMHSVDAMTGSFVHSISPLLMLQAGVQQPWRPFADVTLYGARGNGTTNDSAAFTRALNFLQTKGGGILWCPSGSYYFGNTTINWSTSWDNIDIVGPSDGTARFIWNHGNTNSLQGIIFNAPTGRIDNVSFRNITFQGQANNNTDCAYDLVNYRNNIYNLTFEGCTFKWFYHAGIMQSSVTSAGSGINILFCTFLDALGGNSGGAMTGGSGAAIQGKYNNMMIIGNKSVDIATVQNGHFIYFDDTISVSNIMISYNIVTYVNDPSVINDITSRSSNISGLIISNNIFGPGCRMVQLGGGHRNVVVSGNSFIESYIELQTINGCNISDNTFYDSRASSVSFIQHTASGTSPTNVRIANNKFEFTSAATQGFAVVDSVDGSSRWYIEDNTFLLSVRPGISFRGSNSIIESNKFVSDATTNSNIRVIEFEGTSSNNLVLRNTIWTTQSPGGTSSFVLYNDSTGSGNRCYDNHIISEASGQDVNIGGSTDTSFSNIVPHRAVWTQISDVTVTNTTTETTLISSGRGYTTLPIHFFRIGKRIRLRAYGRLSTSSTPGTVTIRFKFGSTNIATTSSFTPTAGMTNALCWLDIEVVCRSTSASGTIYSQGRFGWEGASNETRTVALLNTSAITINTRSSHTIDLTWQWGSASASNSVTITNLCIDEEH